MAGRLKRAAGWLSQTPGVRKHEEGWAHPMAACAVHYTIAVLSTIAVNDWVFFPFLASTTPMVKDLVTPHELVIPPPLVSLSRCEPQTSANAASAIVSPYASSVSKFVSVYVAALLLCRLAFADGGVPRRAVLYEFTWLCNSAMVLAPIGLSTCRPLLATGPAVAVSIDQVLWYVDVVGWTLSGFTKFPVGVAKYLTWPQTSWVTVATCSHHFWTIPLLMLGSGGKMTRSSYLMSIYIVTSHVALSRWLTPFVIPVGGTKKEEDGGRASSDKKPDGGQQRQRSEDRKERYLNVNLSYGLWRDIKFWWLPTCVEGDPPVVVFMMRLLWRWHLFNLAVFMGLSYIGEHAFRGGT